MKQSTTPLSVSQELIWAGSRLAPGSPLYNMALRVDFGWSVDSARFAAAVDATVAGADALRMTFPGSAGNPEIEVRDEVGPVHQLIDLSRADDPEWAADRWIEDRVRRPFDLATACFDSALLRLGADRWIWFYNQHHLVTDAWSAGLVFRRVAAHYTSLGEPDREAQTSLSSLPSFAEQIRQTRRAAAADPSRTAAAHWLEVQRAAPQPPLLYGRHVVDDQGRSRRIRVALGAERADRLKQLSMADGVRLPGADLTRFALFATALFAWLVRVSGQRDLTIGAPSHNRRSRQERDTIGLFVELFPLTVSLPEGVVFRTLFEQVAEQAQALLFHGLPGTSTPASVRLFNVVLNYLNVRFGDFDGRPARVTWLDPGAIDPGHALRLHVQDFEGQGRFELLFDVNLDQLDEALAERIPGHFLRVFDAMVRNFDAALDTVALGEGADAARLVGAPSTDAENPPATVLAAFDTQAEQTPDAPAIEFADETISYAELAARSRATASALRERGVRPGEIVGICARRSPELLVAVLGVLRAGAAYLPLEPGLPAQRLRLMLKDSDSRVVLADASGATALARAEAPIETLLPAAVGDSAQGQADFAPVDRGAAAYLLYTSGSTGVPKGVLVEHGGLADYVRWAHRAFGGSGPVSFPLHTAFGFDLTVTSLFVPLVSGGTVVIYPEPETGPDLSVLDVFADDRVDVVKLTPSHLALALERIVPPRRIRALILGGEDWRTDLARRADSALGGRVALFNEYGPTEAVVGCMQHRFDPELDRDASVPIGLPAEGVDIYLLDAGLHAVPAGVEGEIFIAGERLARGYLGREDLTAERFLADPRRRGGRMYRTGDRARWDGRKVHYLGRADGQVKIRGARVELAEVEAALAAVDGVVACVAGAVADRPAPTEKCRCVRCGLSSRYPGTTFDEQGVCNVCQAFDAIREQASAYFHSMAELEDKLADAAARRTGAYDCIMLLSGGKDSTYALFQLARITPRILTITLDNGFISDGAKANIRRAVEALGIDHRYVSTPAMDRIFVDSLERHSNVCNGCFKTIYTLAVQTALEEGIPVIVTGLSRGQLFETRLTPELFTDGAVDNAAIDRTVLEARKAYHRVDDAVSELLDVSAVRRDDTWEHVEFVDFYRYCDVPLAEVYRFLEAHAPWVRPEDTGRSTNCLINELGIWYHTHREGFHNYALPYSWDVRLGHKERDAALEELDDRIDPKNVLHLSEAIGFHGALFERPEGQRLAAWFVSEGSVHAGELRKRLAEVLPEAMIPSHLIEVDEIPLTANGKIDRAALPDPRHRRSADAPGYRPPRTGIERALAALWSQVLGVSPLGLDDDFYEVGGDSIAAIQIVARARDQGMAIDIADLFERPSIGALAARVGATATTDATPRDVAPERERFSLAKLDAAGLDQVARALGGDPADREG